MNSKFLIFLSLILAYCNTLAQPITLARSDLAVSVPLKTGAIYQSTTLNGLSDIVGRTGENQIFDFSEMDFSFIQNFRIEAVPYISEVSHTDHPHFSKADRVAITLGPGGKSFAFHKLEDDGFYWLGVPPGLVLESLTYPLPLAYGDAWTNNNFLYDENVLVDSWGTLMTPQGEAACLRIHRTRNYADGTKQTEFEYVTKDGKLSAAISLDSESGLPNFASYDFIDPEPIENKPDPIGPITITRVDMEPEASVTVIKEFSAVELEPLKPMFDQPFSSLLPTYDFSIVDFELAKESRLESAEVSAAPGKDASHFSEANYIAVSQTEDGTDVYSYFRFDETGVYSLGVDGAPVTEKFHPLPLKQNQFWQDSNTDYIEVSSVLGKGILITPVGKSECLAVKRTRFYIGSAMEDEEELYFLTKGGQLAASIIKSEETGEILSATYTIRNSVHGANGSGGDPAPTISLAIREQGAGEIQIHWTDTDGSLVLQSSEKVGDLISWKAVNTSPVKEGEEWVIPLPKTASARFYRLKSSVP